MSIAMVTDQTAPVTPDTHTAPVQLDRSTVEQLAREAFEHFVERDAVYAYKREQAHNAGNDRDDALRTFQALDTLIHEAQDDPPFTQSELEHAADTGDDMPFRKLWRMACR